MHVGRGLGDVAQRGWFECPFELFAFGSDETQFTAVVFACIAPRTQTVELIVENLDHARCASVIKNQSLGGGDACVVKVIVGK